MPNNSINLSITRFTYFQNIDLNKIKSELDFVGINNEIDNFAQYSVNITSISCEYDIGAYPDIETIGNNSLEQV